MDCGQRPFDAGVGGVTFKVAMTIVVAGYRVAHLQLII